MKRGVDIVFSAILLMTSVPVLLLSAMIIRITSPGPILFRQQRMGLGFKPFEILKLRTMAHAEAGLAYTLGPDPRITPFGKWLRRTKLDEIPQLWNVLRGDMSLVGPRPVLPELTAEFPVDYALLLKARPGLTDPASLKYSQEARILHAAQDPMHFFKTVVTPDKIRISLDYMESANLWTDTATMAMTLVICFFPGMSRIYGEIPDLSTVPTRRPMPVVSVTTTIRASPLPTDSCIFSSELIHVEAMAEEGLQLDRLPWILLQIPGLGSQSAPSSARGGASRL